MNEGFDINPKDNARRWMVESLCVPILESAGINLVDKYFQKFAKKLWELITKYPNGPDRKKDIDTVKLQLLDLECGYKLLSVQYERLHRTSVEKIGVDYKTVIKTAHKHVKNFGVQGKQDSHSQIAFQVAAYNCLAHCILCTQCPGGSINVFTKFLFQEKPNKGQVLWSNIIDLNVNLLLSIDTNFGYSLRRITRKFLQNETEHGLSTNNLLSFDSFASQSQALVNKSSLRHDFEALSLSQTGYSFQPKRENTKDEMDQDGDDDINGSMMDIDDDNKDEIQNQEIVLELDPLNKMAVMPSMLAAMDGLQKHFSSQWKDAGIPDWMNSILKKLQDQDRMQTHPNIRYFIAKLIINRPKIFEPYSDLFFKPLVDLFIYDDITNWGFHYFLRDICELFLFKWASFVPETSVDDSAQRFINHLIKMVPDYGDGNSKQRKVTQNVNYIKLLLTKWKGIDTVQKINIYRLLSVDVKKKQDAENLSVGDKILMEYLNKTKSKTKIIPCEITKVTKKEKDKIMYTMYRVKLPGNETQEDVLPRHIYKRDFRLEKRAGLYLIDALTEANFPAYDKNEDNVNNEGLDIGTFFQAFCSGFTCDSRPVWKAASKVYGDLLRKEDENIKKSANFQASFSVQGCMEQIKKIIAKIIGTDLPKAIEMMHRIGNEFPEFLDYQLIQNILGSLGHIPVQCLTDSISLFAKYVSVENPDPEVAIWLRPGLQRLFDHNDHDAHLAVCDVFLRLIPVIKKDIKEEYLPMFIAAFKDHKNHRVRRKLLGILSHCYDNEPEIDQTIRNQIKEVLLAALADPNSTNRKLMFEFWGHETRLNETIVERLDDLLTKLFTTTNEHLWLHYASFLLLEPMRKSPDFKQLISHRPLSECKFEEYNIDSQWGGGNTMTQNFALTPMFTSSLPSSQEFTPEQRTMLSFSSLAGGYGTLPGQGYVRATQQRIWTQTQTQAVNKLPSPMDKPEKNRYGSGKNQTFIWSQAQFDANDSQSSDDADKDLRVLFAGSYAEFERGPQGKGLFGDKNRNRAQKNLIGKVVASQHSDRFNYKAAKKGISRKIGGYDMNKRYAKAWEESQRESLANKVNLYRKYRKGELPDICIPHSDIQLPLQALHTDPVIAKELFIIFFKSIYEEAVKRSDRRNNYKASIETAMVSILRACNDHSSIVSTLLLCATELDNLQIEPKYVADLSIKSNNLYSGVVLLENMLMNGESIEQQKKPNKRRKVVKKEENAAHDALSFKDKIHSQLTRLYNLLGEQDTVLALSTNFAKMQETKDGVESYMKGNYWDAYNSYLSAQKTAKQQGDRCGASILEKTLWKEESMKCLHKLAKWDTIYDGAVTKVSNLNTNNQFKDNLWNFLLNKEDLDLTEQSTLEQYFSDWLLSSVKKEKVWQNQLYKLVDEWIINEQLDETQKRKRDYMENKYSPILAFLYSTKNDLIRTKFYCTKSYELLLDKWCNLPKFAVGAKKILLSKLQALVEINEFVSIVKMEGNDNKRRQNDNINDSEDILAFWRRRFPKVTDDVLIWDDITFYRRMFSKKINDIQSADYLKDLITDCQVDTLYESINSMIYQKNYTVAEEYIKDAALLGSFNPKFKLQHITLSLNTIMDSKKKTDKEKVQGIQQLNDRLTNYFQDATMKDMENEMCLLKGKMLFEMASFVDDDGTLLRYVNKAKNVKDIYKNSRESYRKSLKIFQDDEEDEKEPEYAVDGDENMAWNIEDESKDDEDNEMADAADEEDIGQDANAAMQKLLRQREADHAKAHMELALFCNRRLLTLEEKVRKDFEKKESNKIKLFTMIREYSEYEIDLGKEFIENVMKAMQYNSDDARDMFPRVLECAEMDVKTLGKLVVKLSKRIPCWMFIRWIPQMLAELGSHSVLREYVMPILLRIARMYAGALIYPFNLTSEDLEDDAGAQKYIKKLNKLLSMMPGYDLASAFTEALDCMCHPNLKFGDYCKEISGIVNDKRLSKKIKVGKVEDVFKEMIADLFTKSKKYVKSQIGNENSRFMRLFGKTVFSKFGKKGEKIKSYQNKLPQITKILGSIRKQKEMDSFSKGKKAGGKLPLSEYSDWLSSFDASRYDEALYVPGQFSGMVKPDLTTHLKIVSFDGITLIMGSLRKPKRIKLRTNDEREQMWLAKAGEDLRMDERIEQMFKIANSVLVKNTICVDRNLVLRTYDVIPMNRSTGIIEWIPNTIPIKSLVEDSMKRLKVKETMYQITLNHYVVPLTKILRAQHGAKMYCKAIEGIARYNKKLIEIYERAQNKIQPTTLQLAIINMSRNKESYIQLRDRFCKTLSVYTLCGYVLGIGDRHLDNFLVDESTGQVIGIDFGAAFGYGLGLPVPELMPCRLTRQFLNIMNPLNTKTHIRNYMIYVMQALVEKKDNLLNIMNVFIKEPSLDWIELANKNFQKSNAKGLMDKFDKDSLSLDPLAGSSQDSQSSQGASSQSTSATQKKELLWYPKHKIYIAKLKLNRYKSTYVMKEEISSTQHYTAKYRKQMESLIDGYGDKMRKIYTKNKCDSIEDQIDCLIDHADDKNILSLTWQGWLSWC